MFVQCKMLLLLVLLPLQLSSVWCQLSWCNPELCNDRTDVKHIACENYGFFAPRCQPDATMIDINPYRHVFVDEHNKRRNLIASGQLPGYYPASRMATMVWDEELQYLAALNVRTCILDHDDCYHTYRFKNCGQNLCAISRLKYDALNVTSLIDETIRLWFDNEHHLVDSSYVTAFRVAHHFEDYGHFTEMIVDRNIRLGCAIMQYTRPDYPYVHVYHVVCNYASVYALGAPLYNVGRPGSGCITGVNPRYPALCSVKEYFDPNY
ncbi:antigen 5 like allergen Cul n 1-like [Musca vetustissima]|uniref:antigen 5 like allergen Cul n 1-like n=1 Tax=Musca vetustissima TaxID=27455 RepID=UPI002AB6C9EF|nr:antigen 5 like allergen Cul n 1-like [Musca vetustissima]